MNLRRVKSLSIVYVYIKPWHDHSAIILLFALNAYWTVVIEKLKYNEKVVACLDFVKVQPLDIDNINHYK